VKVFGLLRNFSEEFSLFTETADFGCLNRKREICSFALNTVFIPIYESSTNNVHLIFIIC